MENNKKILILTLEYPPQIGGIASYISDLVQNLPSGVATVVAPITPGGAEYDKLHAVNVIRHKFYWPLFWPRWTRILWHIILIVKKNKFTNLHIHHTLPLGYVGYIISVFFKVPYTIFLHGSDFQLATKGLLKKHWFKFVCNKAQTIVVNSEFSQNLVKNFVVDQNKILVIYPCPSEQFYSASVDQTIVNKLKTELALHGKKVLISAARMVDRKGLLLLADLLPKIIKQVPNLVWLVVGDGPERAKLLKKIQELNLLSVVRFLSYVPREQTINYYQLANVFCLLTHKDKDGVEEAWGTTFIEVAACGLPVVAGNSGGTSEAVINGQTGLVVDANNAKEVAEAVVTLMNNSEFAANIGQNAKQRAYTEFRWKTQLIKLGL